MREKVRGLDGLRALAAFLVFFHHRYAGFSVSLGAMAVRLFFVISGYLIVGILIRERSRIQAGSTTASAALLDFMRSRALRIFPLYFFALGLVVVTDLRFANVLANGELIYHASFLSNFYIATSSWESTVAHFWSLSVEEQFYFITGPVLLFGLLSAGRLSAMFIGLALSTVLYLFLQSATDLVIYTNSLVSFGAIAVGGLLHTVPEGWTAKVRRSHLPVALALFLLVPFLITSVASFLSVNPFIALMLVNVPMAGAVVFTIVARQDGPFIALLERPLIADFGKLSYGFYVWHFLMTPSLIWHGTAHLVNVMLLPVPVRLAVLFAGTLIAARASWVLIEKPALGLKDRLRSGSRNEENAAAALTASAS